MSKSRIILNNIPNQEGTCNLTNSNGDVFICDYKIRTLTDGEMCIDLTIDGVVYCLGRACIDRMPLLFTNRLGGNLYFEDKFGQSNPKYDELNTRYNFIFDTDYIL